MQGQILPRPTPCMDSKPQPQSSHETDCENGQHTPRSPMHWTLPFIAETRRWRKDVRGSGDVCLFMTHNVARTPKVVHQRSARLTSF